MGFENTPLRLVDYSFIHYLNERKRVAQGHLQGNGLPDYAYAPDFNLRRQLDSIPHLYNVGYNICSTYASQTIQELNMYALAVTSNQFPEIYEIGKSCARRLGIGIPNIFIVDSPAINASTIATDDVEPVIMLNSGLVERYSIDELKMIIGHECGHIHNQHGVYHILCNLIFNEGLARAGGVLGLVGNLITCGATLALKHWNRAAEVTCDRAGMICTDSVEDSYKGIARLLYGAMFNRDDINIEEIEKQLERQHGTIAQLETLVADHPTVASRIAAMKIFGQCETFYNWRPDLRTPELTTISQREADQQCESKVNIKKGDSFIGKALFL